VRAVIISILLCATLVADDGWIATHPPRIERTAPPLTLGVVTDEALAAFRIDGSSDIAELEAMLGRIREGVAVQVAVPTPGETAPADPHSGSGWRLWVFWAHDAPECAGLASALLGLRATGLATIRAVHLASLRAYEAQSFRMNEFREAMWAAARAQDQGRCDAIAVAWEAAVADGRDMTRAFHGGRLPLVARADQACALRVESVPCFRLISPAGRVHALDGFAPTVDLAVWVTRAQAWEDEFERRQQQDGSR